jgi:hypothetical protein
LSRHDIFSRRKLVSKGPKISRVTVVCRPFIFNGQWLFAAMSQYKVRLAAALIPPVCCVAAWQYAKGCELLLAECQVISDNNFFGA